MVHLRFARVLPLLLIAWGAVETSAATVHGLDTPTVTLDGASRKTAGKTAGSSTAPAPGTLGAAASSCRIGAELATQNQQLIGVGATVCLIGIYFGIEDFLREHSH